MEEQICCPRVDPASWDEKTLEWSEKKFVKGHVRTFLFMPINFGQVITKIVGQVESSGGQVTDNLVLSDHASKSNMDVLVATNKDIPGAENVTVNGKFFSKMYEGPFKDTGKWMKDFEAQLQQKNITAKHYYTWYTTCPKCAKKYGKNYVAIFAQV